MSTLNSESHFIEVSGSNKIHIKQWSGGTTGEPVLMIHGSIENGRIFYSEKGKGFAPFLAEQGYNVFVADLRGRGKSTPAISRESDFGNHEMINEDIPKMVEWIQGKTGTKNLWVVGHSWGGNLLMGWLARYPEAANVLGMINFGTRRAITIWNWERFYKLSLAWGIFGKWKVKSDGFLDAKRYNLGADNETLKTYHETNTWLLNLEMKDPCDGFDYLAAMGEVDFPPVLSITGGGDKTLGNPTDCERTARDSLSKDLTFKIIGKKTGHKHNYDHINLLTHKDAGQDHFQLIIEWMKALTR